MAQPSLNVESLRRSLTDEIAKVIGLSETGWARRLVEAVVSPPARRFASLAASFDQRVAQAGFCEAARWVLPVFARGVEVYGMERVPTSGPLLVAANHPGVCDVLAIAASLPRPDLKIVASGMPFIRSLPATGRHLIYVSRTNLNERMIVVREAIRHLLDGNALLIFPSGSVDPDPAILPGADIALEGWSGSVEILLRKVSQVRVLVTIVSGVVSDRWMHAPLTRLRKGLRDRQKLAEILQVVQQMLFPYTLSLTPKVSFSQPLTTAELCSSPNSPEMMPALIARAKALLAEHMAHE